MEGIVKSTASKRLAQKDTLAGPEERDRSCNTCVQIGTLFLEL